MLKLRDKLPPEITFEVQTDPWALRRVRATPEREGLIAIGFEHLGYQFCYGSAPWERAQVGYTVEVLVDPERTVLCSLDEVREDGLVSLLTLLEDGAVVRTCWVPDKVFADPIIRMVFESRPPAGRFSETHDTLDPAKLLERHRERVRELAARRGSPPVVHNMRTNFAITLRGLQVAMAANEAMGRGFRGILALLVVTLVVALSLSLWFREPLAAIAVSAATMPLLLLLWRLGLNPWLPRRPWPDAASVLSDPWVTERLGDHEPIHGSPFVQAPKSVQDRLRPR